MNYRLAPHTLVGIVRSFDGRYYAVECDVPETRAYLRHHNLTHRVMNNAEIGDTVTLTYYSTSSMGYWYVSRVTKGGK